MKYISLDLVEVPEEVIEQRIKDIYYPKRLLLIDIKRAIAIISSDPYLDPGHKNISISVLNARLSQVIQSLEN